MSILAELGFFAHLLNTLIILLGILLISVVLIQRGKGGGLAGAFGGVGGSSPFGSKAGDAFTRFTIILALVWIGVIIGQVWVLNPTTSSTGVPESSLFPTTNEATGDQ